MNTVLRHLFPPLKDRWSSNFAHLHLCMSNLNLVHAIYSKQSDRHISCACLSLTNRKTNKKNVSLAKTSNFSFVVSLKIKWAKECKLRKLEINDDNKVRWFEGV